MKSFGYLVLAVGAVAAAGCDHSTRESAHWPVEEERAAAEQKPGEQAASAAVQDSATANVWQEQSVAPDPAELVAHEWGTFTSVQGSDGRVLAGLHHEEESLPGFVYGRATAQGDGCPPTKCLEALPSAVTQKLETPVIYFYAPERVDMRVKVDFPQGIISQWYPNAVDFGPPIGGMGTIGGGTMTWDVTVDPNADHPLIEVPPEDVWAPSRNVAAASVTAGDEHERFIFYRGLGAFEVPFRVSSVGEDLTIHNDSPEPIASVYVLQVNDRGGWIHALGEVEAGGRVGFTPTPKEEPLGAYVRRAKDALKLGLVRDGLFDDEAQAMVDTWERSYFETPGLRVLYVVPRAWTDALLPISIEPQPDRLVRTLVGRVEVLTAAEERRMVSRVEAAAAAGTTVETASFGRFAEPKLRRVAELVGPDARPLADTLVAEASRPQPQTSTE